MHDDLALLRGALAGSYLLERKVGAGGMASVYLAQDLKHQRRVAIKVLRPEIATALGSERFLREIQIVARLNHPHIVPLHDSGHAAGFLFFVMPYVEGESLRDRLRREKQLPLTEAVRIAREIADGLGYAHGLGVIHRDIKPENILLSDGHAVLADFGIAQAVNAAAEDAITATGFALGTPAYMSPEQGSGESNLDARSDVYSLACVVYEMLAGNPPFTGPNAHVVMVRKSAGPVPRLRAVRDTAPAAVEAALIRALRPIPADRFDTVREFAEALVEIVTPTRERIWLRRDGHAENRRRFPYGRRLVVGVLALSGAAWLVVAYRGAREEGASATLAVSRPAQPRSTPIRVAVLPPAIPEGNQVSRDEWRVVQHLLASQLTRNRALAVVDPLSLNSRLEESSASRRGDPADELRGWDVPYFVRISITPAPAGLRVSYALTETRKGRIVAVGDFTSTNDDELNAATRIAGGRLLDALESATGGITKALDLDPWLTDRSTGVASVKAFLQGTEYAYRGMSGGGTHFERALALDPGFIAPRVWLVSGLAVSGDTAAALEHVRVLESLAPEASPFEQAMIGWAEATARGDLEGRVRHLRVALEYSPRNNVLLYNLGGTLLTMGRTKEAIEPIREAVESRWRFAPLYTLWGMLAIQSGELAGLRETLEGALSITPQAPYLTGLLEALAVFENDTAAARRFGASLRSQVVPARHAAVFAEMAPVYRSLAQRAREAGEGKRAVTLLQRAVDAQPDVPITRLELARAQAETGERRAAEDNFRLAERRDASAPDLLFVMGETAALLGRESDARAYLTRYLAAAPNGLDAVRARERLRSLDGSRGPS